MHVFYGCFLRMIKRSLFCNTRTRIKRNMFEFKVHVHVHVRVVLYLRGYNKFEKNQQKNVLVTKNTYKSVRASTRARNLSPSSNEIATNFRKKSENCLPVFFSRRKCMDLLSKIAIGCCAKFQVNLKLRRRMGKRGREGARLTDAHTNFE